MKYEPIFKLPYSNILVNSFTFAISYKDYDAIATIKNGKWELFIPKNKLKELSEKRYKEVINGLDFEGFEKESMKAAKEVLELNEVNMSNMDKKEFLEFLDNLYSVGGNFFKIYKETEFFHFTKIERELGKYIEEKFSFQDVLTNKIDLSPWPEKEKRLAEYLIKMQHLKFDLRKLVNKAWMGPDALLIRLFGEVIKRTKREDATSMTLEELKKCLKGKEIKDVSERHVYSYICFKEKFKVISGTEAYKKIRELDKDIPKDQVIGEIASRGIAKGRVKIIPLSIEPEKYLKKMKKGDIIVSDTTGPEMMPAIEKAAAIVTDEGGQMSHAAIVSREFNIPCVVGTKYATEVFKDNDLIEVNANNGIVRKI